MRNEKTSPPGASQQDWQEKRSKLSLTVKGKLVEVKHHFQYVTPSAGGKRSTVTAFTQASRLRLLKNLATFDWPKIENSLFVTLTYPDEEALQSQEQRNRQRYLFHRSLEKEFRRPIPALWRIEWLPRQSGEWQGEVIPHWHYLLFNEPFIPHEFVNDRWKRTIGHDGYCRTEVKAAKQEEAVGMYISKYLGKETVTSSLVYAAYHNIRGRHWGMLRKDLIPKCDARHYHDLDKEEEAFLLEFAKKEIPFFPQEGRQSFTLLGKKTTKLIEKFERIKVGSDGEIE